MKTIHVILATVLLSFLTLEVSAAREEFKKTISKSFDVDKGALLTLKNKFGKIHCENWDRNSISVEVTITVETSSQDKADKYFDKVAVDITGTSRNVSVITNFDDNLFSNNKDEITVDFMINMPKSVELSVDHKFGDLILAEVEGNSSVELGYGTLKARKLGGDENDLEIKFSEGYIGYVKNAQLELKYGELEIDEAFSISAETKFSTFRLGKADVVTLETGYDDDVIGAVRDLDVEAGFSDVEVRSVAERMVADFDYGELNVKEMGSGFNYVEITSSFSDANLGFNPESSFRITATVKMGDLTYPREKARMNEVELSYTSNRYEGVIGTDEQTTAKVVIDAKNAGVRLFYR